MPQRAVSRDEKGEAMTLIVDADGVVQRRLLDATHTVGANWLVKSGIAAGDRVIVEGLQYARAGQKANAVPYVAGVGLLPPPAANARSGADTPPARQVTRMLSRFFIDRPVFAWVIAIVIMLAGVLAILRLPIEQYPTIAPPSVQIQRSIPAPRRRRSRIRSRR